VVNGVSTASGSDPVIILDLDPVAIAPGTDVIATESHSTRSERGWLSYNPRLGY